MRKTRVPNNVQIGKMVAKDFGIKKCGKSDALEVFQWMHRVDVTELNEINPPKTPREDAMHRSNRVRLEQ